MATRRDFITTAAVATASAPLVALEAAASRTEPNEPAGERSSADDELLRYNTMVGLAQSVPSPER